MQKNKGVSELMFVIIVFIGIFFIWLATTGYKGGNTTPRPLIPVDNSTDPLSKFAPAQTPVAPY